MTTTEDTGVLVLKYKPSVVFTIIDSHIVSLFQNKYNCLIRDTD